MENKIQEEVKIMDLFLKDIFNERPSKDDQLAVSIQNETELPTHGKLFIFVLCFYLAIIQTNMGDIHVRLFP